MNISASTSLCHLLTHIFIKGRHHSVARTVRHIVACARDGDGCTISGSYAQDIDTHAFIFRCLSCFERPTLMVLTIGDDDDSLADTFFLSKTMGGHLDGTGDIRTLGCHHRRVDARQEHLCRHIVAGDGKLHKGIARKHNQADLVVSEVVYQILYHHLTTIQTTGDDVLRQHRVTDVQRDDGLYAHALLVTDLRT